MGKGDKKTAKGKRIMGSHGKTRPKKKDAPTVAVVKAEKPAKAPKEVAAKKVTAKKPSTKKAAAEKEA